MSCYKSETSQDVGGTSHHQCDSEVTIIMMIAMNIMGVRNIVKTISLAVAVVIIWIIVTVVTLTHINQAGVMVITGGGR